MMMMMLNDDDDDKLSVEPGSTMVRVLLKHYGKRNERLNPQHDRIHTEPIY